MSKTLKTRLDRLESTHKTETENPPVLRLIRGIDGNLWTIEEMPIMVNESELPDNATIIIREVV